MPDEVHPFTLILGGRCIVKAPTKPFEHDGALLCSKLISPNIEVRIYDDPDWAFEAYFADVQSGWEFMTHLAVESNIDKYLEKLAADTTFLTAAEVYRLDTLGRGKPARTGLRPTL